NAFGSLRWAPYRASFAYAGRVDDRTIARIMERPSGALTRLTGNFRGQVDLLEPHRSMATGTLTCEGLELLEHWGWPISIERMTLDASGQTVTARNTIVKVARQRVTVGGSVAIRPSTFTLDLRAEADRIDAGRLLEAFPRDHGDDRSKLSVW